MRVLLTGGSGFVGRHLARALGERGHEVIAPGRSDWDLRNADRSAQVIREVRPALTFHLAALTDVRLCARDPALAEGVNVAGTAGLCRALGAHAPTSRLVATSTCHVYGRPERLPLGEDHPLRPEGAYATTKASAEAEILASGLDAVVARPFHLTGPGQPATHVASDWARQAAEGATVIRCGNLDLSRDFLDVRDAVAGLLLLAERGQRGAYNLCSGRALALRDLMAAVAPGCRPEVDPARLRGREVTALVGDPSRLCALGWRVRTPLPESWAALRQQWER